jgi:hypothetical protein
VLSVLKTSEALDTIYKLTPSTSADTHTRAKNSNIEVLTTDVSLVEASNYIISIVPPRDALATAQRITKAFKALQTSKPLYYLDLNAISPRSALEIAALFESAAPDVKLIDGGVIGGPPRPKSNEIDPDASSSHKWERPSIPVSGPHELKDAPISGAHLAETLNMKHISSEIGPASGLKCCFASASKGFTALMIQSFTTASSLGVLPLLQEELDSRMPGLLKSGSRGVVSMPPKAYRWVHEMEEIAITHADTGFAGGQKGTGIFGEIAKVYKSVADETVLGEEKTERRKRGLTVEDVASAMEEGLSKKKKKTVWLVISTGEGGRTEF